MLRALRSQRPQAITPATRYSSAAGDVIWSALGVLVALGAAALLLLVACRMYRHWLPLALVPLVLLLAFGMKQGLDVRYHWRRYRQSP